MAFIMLRNVPSIPTLVRDFYHEWMLNFTKIFGLYWDDDMIFVFSFVNVVYHIGLCMLNHPCYLGMNPTWLWCMIFFCYCWIWFGDILLRIFSSIFKGIYLLSFSFFMESLYGFGIRVMVASQMNLGVLPSP